MSDRIEAEANAIREGEAYQDENHEGHQDAMDQLTALYEDHYGTGSAVEHSRTLLDRRMEEALDDLHNPNRHKPDQEARLVEPVVEGGARFGDPMKVDESGNPVGILDRPDLYKIDPDSLVTQQTKLDAMGDVGDEGFEENFDEYMKEIQPKWRSEDQQVLNGLINFGERAGIANEDMKAVFNNFVRSPEFGKSYDVDSGLDALHHYCDGNDKLMDSIIVRAQEAIDQMDDATRRLIIEDTFLGNNPKFIVLMANLAGSHMGSGVDDLSMEPLDFDWDE
jgi:hypothetical protein